jgi:hypothetical protein
VGKIDGRHAWEESLARKYGFDAGAPRFARIEELPHLKGGRMLCSILVRRLNEDVSYDDFQRAWFPDQGFGVSARVRNARRIDDPRELLSVGFVDLPVDQLATGLQRVAAAERLRHDRIAEVIESTVMTGIYEVLDDYDFSSTPGPWPAPGL